MKQIEVNKKQKILQNIAIRINRHWTWMHHAKSDYENFQILRNTKKDWKVYNLLINKYNAIKKQLKRNVNKKINIMNY